MKIQIILMNGLVTDKDNLNRLLSKNDCSICSNFEKCNANQQCDGERNLNNFRFVLIKDITVYDSKKEEIEALYCRLCFKHYYNFDKDVEIGLCYKCMNRNDDFKKLDYFNFL